jgi:signal transduction histidine kinase/CheY-like chemotaxis protein
VGLRHAEVFGPTHSDDVERHDARVVATGAELIAEETVAIDGVTSTFEVVKRPYRDASGSVVGTVGIARDVTERRKLEARVRHAEKMQVVGRLAGGIAHDFNNILTVVLGAAAELRERARDLQTRELVEEVVEGGERAAALTRQLLAFSRRQPVRLQRVDLNVVVHGLERMLRRVIPESVEIEIELHGSPVVVHADVGQLEQVLLNLALNARDAMPAGGRVTIRTAAVERAPAGCGVDAGPCAVLEVRDEGTGIDAAVRPHIFEPFFTTKPDGRGTGLGLATVSGIVRLGGGGIAVETAPGAGTSFRVYLPRVDAAAAAPPPPAPDGARGKEVVLVVEDDPAVRALIRRTLDAAGYAVLEAPGPEQALAVATRADGFDLLLTDVVMPGMSGKDLAARLLASRPGLRVVFVSGYTEDAAVRSGTLPPGQVFLEKPFTGPAIAAAVRAALEGGAPQA